MGSFWGHYFGVMPRLLEGATITIKITSIAVFMGILIGLIMALGNMSKNPLLKIPAKIYINCLRGTPLYVQILLFHFGIPSVVSAFTHQPFTFDVMVTAVVVCSLNSGAYVSEIFRAGIQGIDRGQMEAARSLGMSHKQAMIHIILPQAFKQVIPPLGNEFIVLLKDTSLLAVIGVTEIMKAGQIYTSVKFAPFPTYIGVASVYLVLTLGIAQIVNWTERRLSAGDHH